MEIFKFNILPMDDIEKRQAFKEAVNNCPICNHPLEFKHEIDFLNNQMQEESHCPQCQIEIRNESHSLQ